MCTTKKNTVLKAYFKFVYLKVFNKLSQHRRLSFETLYF